MGSRPAQEHVLVATLLMLFLCRAMLANAVVPPWQGPDEPGHFTTTYDLTLSPQQSMTVQRDVLRSMVRNRFWALDEDPPPDPLPSAFSLIYESSLGLGNLSQPLYYGLGAIALTVSRPAGLETAYYHLRALGVLLAVATLWFGWAGARVLFGSEVAAGALAIGALHPQFLLATLNVNADVLVNFWGAFVWWQAARLVAGRRPAFSSALMMVGAVAALFTKRIGMILVGVALVVAAGSLLLHRTRRFTPREMLFVSLVGGLGAVLVLSIGTLFREQVQFLWSYWADALTPRTSLADASGAEAFRFARMTVDYFWLIAGWLRFQPPISWLWVARILIIAGTVGAVIHVLRSRADRVPLAVVWLFVIAQLAVMLATVFWLAPSAPQARYLFPVFAPITVLLYIGLRRMVPHRYEAQWPVAFVVVLMMLDVTGFTTVHLPSYLP
jgi:hypothetical protein